jgi:hypothetical protein
MEQRSKSVESCLVITTGLLVLFVWLKNPWLLYIALAVGLLGVLSPRAAEIIHQGWMLLARALGWFNGRVLLSAVFFLLLTPIAWLARKVGTMDLQLNKKPDSSSYYVVRDHLYKPKDLENTW